MMTSAAAAGGRVLFFVGGYQDQTHFEICCPLPWDELLERIGNASAA